ncbi:UBX domain-containing protein 4 [Thrips palmi]|uniref:UBX domain-containing protein 4 n=1 Tax=Thrips palmi TaxID=161013 RepID=A0A6P8YZY0_THRPL|nr:UBX domain-containing protein 4 [Thrips palmi]
MRWFQGNIVEAVTQSKARNAVFVVFIEGKDDRSQKIASAIDDADVSSKLEGDNFVSIRLESGTETFTQFSQIYRNPSIPSLYFIGRNGSPIKIVTDADDSKILLKQIVHVENVHFGKSNSKEAPSTQSAAAKASSSKPSETATEAAKPSETATEEPASQPGASSVPLDERVERAKELLEEKRLKKQAEEEEEARQKEMRRRKEGQNIQEMRRLQQEQELKQLKEERMRDKQLEQAARQRVLEQIAQDRAARNARNVPSAPSPAVSGPATAPTPILTNSNQARLQFRLPDGSTHSHTFEAMSTLGDVRQYIVSNITLPYQNFSLATAFPRHEFSSQDNSSTLRDLQLVPSSLVLIVPAGGNSGSLQNSPGLFGFAQTMFLFMTYPLTRLFSFIRVFIFGAPPPAPGSNSGAAAGPAPAQNQANNQQDRRPQRRSGGAYRRAGNSNVHRLHQSNSSSDDENNTWNGNSTQQM